MRLFGSVGFGPFRVGLSGRVGGRRRHVRYWTHPGCRIRHKRQDTADACARRLAAHRP